MNVRDWPRKVSNFNELFYITNVDRLEDFNSHPEKGVVFTEGWNDGPVAAVLRGGINAMAALELLVSSGIREIHIFHIVEKITQLEDIFLATVANEAHFLFDKVRIFWRNDLSVFELAKTIGREYRMLFLGAPLAKSEIPPFLEKLKNNYEGSVTLVRGAITELELAPGDEIFKWIRERTFEAEDFSLPAVLRDGKKRNGLKVTVILPTLNEEKTVGKVIEIALEVKKAGLIDELILIDSSSTDNTVDIARSYGIPIFQHKEIYPEAGSFRGKGEAMFKSAFVSDADIIVWVDTDIENISPTFFYGLLGPIFTNPEIKFVKGYFTRPVRVEAGGIELGGGRVTEILARPWINTFMPELSGFIQPLAGTVAIYRDVFCQMRIPTNYGVEIAMLIQVVEKCGLWATAQVNLGEVIHKSKDVLGLSEMAFQILQVIASLKNDFRSPEKQPILRHIFTARGHFELRLNRFETQWRSY